MIVDSINKYLNHSGNTVLQAVEIAAVNMTDKISKNLSPASRLLRYLMKLLIWFSRRP